MNKNRNYKGTSGLTLLMFVALAFFVFWFTNRVQVRENTISYQSFVKAVEKDQVTDVSISQNKEVPTGVLTISTFSTYFSTFSTKFSTMVFQRKEVWG